MCSNKPFKNTTSAIKLFSKNAGDCRYCWGLESSSATPDSSITTIAIVITFFRTSNTSFSLGVILKSFKNRKSNQPPVKLVAL
jgi:hypothetical protein